MIVYDTMTQILSFVLSHVYYKKGGETYGIADPGFGYIDSQRGD